MSTNLEKWLTALETTDLEQGKEYLHYIDSDDDGTEKFCCLGVGCVVAGIEHGGLEGGTYRYDSGTVVAPASFIEWLGIPVFGDLEDSNEWDIRVYVSDDDWLFDRAGNAMTATTMNDHGLTFAQIAQVLRTHIIKAI